MLGRLLEQGIAKSIGGKGIEGVELLRMPRGIQSIEPFEYVSTTTRNPYLSDGSIGALSTTNIDLVYDPSFSSFDRQDFYPSRRIMFENKMKAHNEDQSLRWDAFKKSKLRERLLAKNVSYYTRLAHLLDQVRIRTGEYIIYTLMKVAYAYEKLPSISKALDSLGQSIKNMWLKLLKVLNITEPEAIDLAKTVSLEHTLPYGFREGDVFSNDRV